MSNLELNNDKNLTFKEVVITSSIAILIGLMFSIIGFIGIGIYAQNEGFLAQQLFTSSNIFWTSFRVIIVLSSYIYWKKIGFFLKLNLYRWSAMRKHALIMVILIEILIQILNIISTGG